MAAARHPEEKKSTDVNPEPSIKDMPVEILKNEINRHFNKYFRRETVAAEEIKLALELLKTKFITQRDIEISEITKIVELLNTAFADRSQTSTVLTNTDAYIQNNDYRTFKISLLALSQNGIRFFYSHEEKIKHSTLKSQQSITAQIGTWQTEIKKIVDSKYKNATDITNEMTMILSHLSGVWIGKNDTLLRSSHLDSKNLELEMKKMKDEIEQLYQLAKDIISISVKQKDELSIIIHLLHLLKENVCHHYPTHPTQLIQANMGSIILGFGEDFRKKSPDFGSQLIKLSAKCLEMSSPAKKPAPR